MSEEKRTAKQDSESGSSDAPQQQREEPSPADNPLGLASEAEKTPQRPGDALLGSYGNAAGDKIESALSPVGKPLGKGLETIGRPVGGLVEPLVGGLMRSGAAFGDAAGVGAGNMDHRRAAEEEERRAPVGAKEQTGENPLGL